jgi:hypothetical protein
MGTSQPHYNPTGHQFCMPSVVDRNVDTHDCHTEEKSKSNFDSISEKSKVLLLNY